MGINKFRDEIYDSKIQILQLDSQGIVVESDDTIVAIETKVSIAKVHPFFEGITPLFDVVSEKIHFPCVNLELDSKNILADVDLIHEEGNVYLLIFDFTEHYRESHPLVQEKNEASILKNKLSFEREVLIVKEDLKNKFLAHLNHEIRNPLNNLLGFMELLENSKLSYEQNETIKIMAKTGKHLKVLLDDLADVSKIEKGIAQIKIVPFSLSQVVNNTVKHFQLKYDKSPIELKLNFDKDLPIRLLGDPTRLNQILFNLIDNAFKNTKEGLISVNVALKELHKKDHSASVLFTISDSGKGIPKEDLPYIFDSYHQLAFNEIKPIGEGLGLRIVKELVKLLNGNIKIESTEGIGTAYEIALPFVVRKKKVVQKKSIPKGTGIVLSKRFLIIENEELTQMLMMKTFINNDSGYLIDIAKNGTQAIKMLEKRNYKLVLLKMKFPDMDGFEIIDHIRTNPNKQISELGILMISGSSMREEQEEVINAGASAFLAKPYTKKELFSKIDSLISL